MVQPSATRCSCVVILWVSLVSFVAITLCVASHRVFTFAKHTFSYRLGPETFGYTLVLRQSSVTQDIWNYSSFHGTRRFIIMFIPWRWLGHNLGQMKPSYPNITLHHPPIYARVCPWDVPTKALDIWRLYVPHLSSFWLKSPKILG